MICTTNVSINSHMENVDVIVTRKVSMYTSFEFEEVAPAIFIYENVLDNSEELIELAKKQAGWSDGTVIKKGNSSRTNVGPVTDGEQRTVQKLDIPASLDNDIRWFALAQRIWHFGDHYGKIWDAPFGGIEAPQLLHYNTNKGFYKPHIDTIPGMINRVFSSVLYLNDVEEGGETYFPKFNVSVKPKAGRMVLFPSNFVYVHEAKQPVSNDKYVVVTWFDE